LRAAGADAARAVAVCTDDPAVTDRIVALVLREFDGVRVLARAWDRVHALRLREAGADAATRETAAAALSLSQEVLTGMGYTPGEAADVMDTVARKDAELMDRQSDMVRGASDRLAALGRIVPAPLTEAQREEAPGDRHERVVAVGRET
jgi:voltage-gated potassium channel Kch